MTPTLGFWLIAAVVAVVVYLLVARQYAADARALAGEAEAEAAKRRHYAEVARGAAGRRERALLARRAVVEASSGARRGVR